MKQEAAEPGAPTISVEKSIEQLRAAGGIPVSNSDDESPMSASILEKQSEEVVDEATTTSVVSDARRRKKRLGTRWWFFAAGSAFLVTVLTIAGIYLLTRKSSTVEKVVITTVPSGADVRLNSNDYGLSPVKLEQLPKGTYTVTITKEGFEPIEEQITVSELEFKFDFKLTPLAPPKYASLSPEERINAYKQEMENALKENHYSIPYEGSWLNYAELFFKEASSPEREELRDAAERLAKEARDKGEFAQSQEIHRRFLDYFYPNENLAEQERARAAARKAKESSEASIPETESKPEYDPTNDPDYRRRLGLDKYRHGQYYEAIDDLKFAISQGRTSAEVIFGLAYSYLKVNQLKEAEYYFNQVPKSNDDSFHSAIAALGEIAERQGDTATALERYKQAKQLGGSILYDIAKLDERIERIEKRQREKAAEPTPLTIQATHLHGSLRGSCKGALTVNSTGVRYDSNEDQFSWNLLSVGVRAAKNELTILVQGKSEKFKVDRADAEQFRETLARYQQANAPGNQ